MKSQTLAGGVLALSVGLSPALAAGTIHVALQIKPGLWEFIDTPKVTGDSVFSDAMLAHIPAAQRVQFLAETRKQMAAPHRARECMTQAKIRAKSLLQCEQLHADRGFEYGKCAGNPDHVPERKRRHETVHGAKDRRIEPCPDDERATRRQRARQQDHDHRHNGSRAMDQRRLPVEGQ
jgi:hypothetical protein